MHQLIQAPREFAFSAFLMDGNFPGARALKLLNARRWGRK